MMVSAKPWQDQLFVLATLLEVASLVPQRLELLLPLAAIALPVV